jgi:GxxExxY protein
MEPQMNADERRLNQITEKVIECAYRVSNKLGCGFLERVYENAMFVDLTLEGLKAEQQRGVQIFYRDALVGEYVAELIVEGVLLLELKAVKALDEVHVAQCLNYLKATGLKVAILINFAKPKIEIRRVVLDL